MVRGRSYFLSLTVVCSGCASCFSVPDCDLTPNTNCVLGTSQNCAFCGDSCGDASCVSGFFGPGTCGNRDAALDDRGTPDSSYQDSGSTHVAILSKGPNGLAACNGTLYWLDGDQLWASPGGLLKSGLDPAGGMACGPNGVLFGITAPWEAGAIDNFAIDGGLTIVVGGTVPARGIAVSGTSLAWIDQNGSVVAFDVVGDGAAPLALNPADWHVTSYEEHLAVTSDSIFSVADGGMYRAAFDGDGQAGPSAPALAVGASSTNVFVLTPDLNAVLADGGYALISSISDPAVIAASEKTVYVSYRSGSALYVNGYGVNPPYAQNTFFKLDFEGPPRYLAADAKHAYVATDTGIWMTP